VALEGTGHKVKNHDIVRLRHLVTDSWLLTHDVASPYFPTNQEFTTVPPEVANGDRFNETLFEIRIDNGKDGQEFKSLSSHFKLVHVPTKVAMWTHNTPLPDWAYKQAEINGNKNALQTSNTWFVEAVEGIPEGSPRLIKEVRNPKYLPFMRKYLELQRAMFYHNNALTSSHPYASFPIQWPFLLRGVSFWTESTTKRQIYFMGNPLGWWFASALLAVFAGIIFADQMSVRRGVDALDRRKSSRIARVLTIANCFQVLVRVCTTALGSSSSCGRLTTSPSTSWAVSFSCITTSLLTWRLVLSQDPL
jgi:dolichyl-phosphate-mannose-protein mannosyltransferase